LLFVATVASVYLTGLTMGWSTQEAPLRVALVRAAQYTVALLSILLAHEFGHFIAARIHKVDASLPYFLPLPFLSPFGTMGAVIRMRSVIPTRRALLDIGAAGPLAGLVLAIPIYAIGVRTCEIVDVAGLAGADGGSMIFGESLLTRLLDHWFAPPVPEGMDRLISPLEHAGWAGMFVTMINLIPVGQLDGGHVAFSLFGPRQNRIAQWVHRSMLVFFFVSVASFVARDVRGGFGLHHIGQHVNNSLFWLLWFEVLAILGAVSSQPGREPDRMGVRNRIYAILGLLGLASMLREKSAVVPWALWFLGLALLIGWEVRDGALRSTSTTLDHPATSEEPLKWGRAAVAVVTLAFFALLFMPTPIAM
jgi:membrane-associated protease RseP (regulator of RpoE activity)